MARRRSTLGGAILLVALLPGVLGPSPTAAHPSAWGRSVPHPGGIVPGEDAWGRSAPHPGAIVPDEPVTTTTVRVDDEPPTDPSGPQVVATQALGLGQIALYAVGILAVVGLVTMALLGLVLGAIHLGRRLVTTGRR